jgi:hypothetical protein
MELGATYERPLGRVRSYVGADLVGSPTLGPVPFMHRESARSNPQVPLTHHFMDSTHITTGVVRGGLSVGPVTLESSVFRGAEPDENRLNLERPRLGSWAARVQYTRVVAHSSQAVICISRSGSIRSIALSHGIELDSTDRSAGDRSTSRSPGAVIASSTDSMGTRTAFWRKDSLVFRRAQRSIGARSTGKDLVVDVHPKIFPPPVIYMIDAHRRLSRDLSVTKAGRFGVGADATSIRCPTTAAVLERRRVRFTCFLRWRPVGAMHGLR